MLKRLITLAAVLLVLLPSVGSIGLARSSAAATPVTATVVASPVAVAVRGHTTLTCSSFAPNEIVVVRLSGFPHLIATGRASASGTAIVSLTIPAGATLGLHRVTVLGLSSRYHVMISVLVQPAIVTPAPPIVTPVHPLQVPANAIVGKLTGMNNAVLSVVTNGVTYTVNTTTTTTIVRLYNGPSALDEMSLGDYLIITGTAVTTNTINATWIKDQSIQRAWTRMAGKITAVTGAALPATVAVTVVKDRLSAPFALGQSIPLVVGASTQVISPTAAGSTMVLTGASALATLTASTGKTVTVLGTYDRVGQSFTTVYRLFIHRP